jgi:adenylate cyclase
VIEVLVTPLAILSRAFWRGAGPGLACGLAVWLLLRVPLVVGLENWMLDGCFSYRSPRPSRANVVLVGLDDDSLDDLRKPLLDASPELAEVVSFLKARGAAAVGIDLLIPDSLKDRPELAGPGAIGDARALGNAILQAGNVVLPRWRSEGRWRQPLPQWRLKAFLSPDPNRTDLGFVNLTEDADQFVRRQQLLVRDGEEAVPSFALALYARSRGTGFRWDEAGGRLFVGEETVPLDAEQKLAINFVGPPRSFFPVLPFRDVLAAARGGPPLPHDLAGATVLVGVTARSQQDYHETPYANTYFRPPSSTDAPLMSGPEIHAHVLATLLDRAYLVPLTWLASLPVLLAGGAGLGMLFARLNLELGALVALAFHFGWKALAVLAFGRLNWQLPMVPVLLLGGLTFAATFALRWRRLRRMLGVIKSEAVARALEADPAQLDRRGQERVVTVLFADIRNFTPFSEAHTAREVVALLNAYFSAVVPVIEAHGGTLNQYMGDGIMVIFGAPAACPDHALRAVRAAVGMVRRVHELKATWARFDRLKVWVSAGGMRIGIGIHTGSVVVGTVGSAGRLDYTAIGDTVNAAARIEAKNKDLGTEVLISNATYEALPAAERARLGCTAEPAAVPVKGKKEALHLHRVEVGA